LIMKTPCALNWILNAIVVSIVTCGTGCRPQAGGDSDVATRTSLAKVSVLSESEFADGKPGVYSLAFLQSQCELTGDCVMLLTIEEAENGQSTQVVDEIYLGVTAEDLDLENSSAESAAAETDSAQSGTSDASMSLADQKQPQRAAGARPRPRQPDSVTFCVRDAQKYGDSGFEMLEIKALANCERKYGAKNVAPLIRSRITLGGYRPDPCKSLLQPSAGGRIGSFLCRQGKRR
jgi:hypothetical protein